MAKLAMHLVGDSDCRGEACVLLRQAPYGWRHARLASLRAHVTELVEQKKYKPLSKSGPFDDDW